MNTFYQKIFSINSSQATTARQFLPGIPNCTTALTGQQILHYEIYTANEIIKNAMKELKRLT